MLLQISLQKVFWRTEEVDYNDQSHLRIGKMKCHGDEVIVMYEKEFLEYWKNQFIVEYFEENYCCKCPHKPLCWHIEGAVYYPDTILILCKHEKMKDTIKALKSMKPQPWNLGDERQCKLVEMAKELALKEIKENYDDHVYFKK